MRLSLGANVPDAALADTRNGRTLSMKSTMKTGMALVAITGMLSAPLAMAQDSVPDSAVQAPAAQAAGGGAPASGGASGLASALGISNVALTVGIGAAIAVAVGVAASGGGSSSSGTN